ncbi:hypothetical protein HZU77_012065 [Neisseriaceae bacterium TC5R-5]|nr:hypothetical protein [Neisseriaceae bacterium TC5R-5]
MQNIQEFALMVEADHGNEMIELNIDEVEEVGGGGLIPLLFIAGAVAGYLANRPR